MKETRDQTRCELKLCMYIGIYTVMPKERNTTDQLCSVYCLNHHCSKSTDSLHRANTVCLTKKIDEAR